MRRRIAVLALVACLGSLEGCAPPAPIVLDAAGVTPSADCGDLAAVLREAVDSHGQVLKDALTRCADRLDAQLKRMQVSGPTATPELFPSPDSRLAYWYNASAAWSMKLAMAAGFPEKMAHAQLHLRSFRLDGRTMTLEEVGQILARDEDFRAGLLAPSVWISGGPLPQKPFTAEDIRGRIAEGFNAYIADQKRFVIDLPGKRILYPEEIWQIRRRLIRDYEQKYHTQDATLTSALLPYTSGMAYTRLQEAIGYAQVQAQPKGLLALPEKFSFLDKPLW